MGPLIDSLTEFYEEKVAFAPEPFEPRTSAKQQNATKILGGLFPERKKYTTLNASKPTFGKFASLSLRNDELEKVSSLLADQFMAATSLTENSFGEMDLGLEILAGYKSFSDEVAGISKTASLRGALRNGLDEFNDFIEPNMSDEGIAAAKRKYREARDKSNRTFLNQDPETRVAYGDLRDARARAKIAKQRQKSHSQKRSEERYIENGFSPDEAEVRAYRKKYNTDFALKGAGLGLLGAVGAAKMRNKSLKSFEGLSDLAKTTGRNYVVMGLGSNLVNRIHDSKVMEYRKNHPDSKLTYNQIIHKYNPEDKSSLASLSLHDDELEKVSSL